MTTFNKTILKKLNRLLDKLPAKNTWYLRNEKIVGNWSGSDRASLTLWIHEFKNKGRITLPALQAFNQLWKKARNGELDGHKYAKMRKK